MSVRLIGVRLEADVAPLRAGLDEAGQLLGRFDQAAVDLSAHLADAGQTGAAAFRDLGQLGATAGREIEAVNAGRSAANDNIPASVEIGTTQSVAALDRLTEATAQARSGLTDLETVVRTDALADFDETVVRAAEATAALAASTAGAAPPFSALSEALNQAAAATATAHEQMSGAAAIFAFQDVAPEAVAAVDAVAASTFAALEATGKLNDGLYEAVPIVGEFACSYGTLDESVRTATLSQRNMWGVAELASETLAASVAASREAAAGNDLYAESLRATAELSEQAVAETVAYWGALDQVAKAQLSTAPATQQQKIDYVNGIIPSGDVIARNPFANDNGDFITTITKTLDETQARVAAWVQQMGGELSGVGEAFSVVGITVQDLAEGGFGILESAAAQGAEAFDAVGLSAETAAGHTEVLDTRLTETAHGITAVKQAATRTGGALAGLSGAGTGTWMAEFEQLGGAVEDTLVGMAGDAELLTGSMSEMGAAGAAAGGAVHSAIGALTKAGPAGLVAAAAFGSVVASLYSGFNVAVKMEEQTNRLNQTLRASGASAWLSADQLRTYADTLSRTTMAGKDEVLAAGQALTQYHSVIGDSFERTLSLSQDMAAAFGGTLTDQVRTLGQALEAPEKALDRLTAAGVRFTDEERALIREAAEAGRTFEAQRLILDAVARDIGGSGAGERAGLVGRTRDLTEAWNGLVTAVTGSDSAVAQAAATVLNGVTSMITALNAAVNASDQTRIAALRSEQQRLQKDIETYNPAIDLNRLFGGSSLDTLKHQLAEIDVEIARIETGYRQKLEVAQREADGRAGAERLARQGVLSKQLESLHKEHEQRLAELTKGRIDKVGVWQKEQHNRLNALALEYQASGMNDGVIKREIELVNRIEVAERTAVAAAKQREAGGVAAGLLGRLAAATAPPEMPKGDLYVNLQSGAERYRQAVEGAGVAQARLGAGLEATLTTLQDEDWIGVPDAMRRVWINQQVAIAGVNAELERQGKLQNYANNLIAQYATPAEKALSEVRKLQEAASGGLLDERTIARKLSDMVGHGSITAGRAVMEMVTAVEAGAVRVGTAIDVVRLAYERGEIGARQANNEINRLEKVLENPPKPAAEQALERTVDLATQAGNAAAGWQVLIEQANVPLNYRVGLMDRLISATSEAASQAERLARATGVGNSSAQGSPANAGVYHDGGMVGAAGVGRWVDPGAFINAPRYHDGTPNWLRTGEQLAILERGEVVLSRAQVAALSGRTWARGGVSVSVNAPVAVHAGAEVAPDAVAELVVAQLKPMLIERLRATPRATPSAESLRSQIAEAMRGRGL